MAGPSMSEDVKMEEEEEDEDEDMEEVSWYYLCPDSLIGLFSVFPLHII